MTDDDTPRVYLTAVRSGMSTTYEPCGPEDMGAEEWVPKSEVVRLKRWRLEEKAKIQRQRKALTDLKMHCARVEAERDGLARKVAAVQRSGDDLAHSELADLQARVHNQRQEIARLRAKEAWVPKEDLDRLREALRSIAANTCCEDCQEAARVARAALPPPSDEEEA